MKPFIVHTVDPKFYRLSLSHVVITKIVFGQDVSVNYYEKKIVVSSWSKDGMVCYSLYLSFW